MFTVCITESYFAFGEDTHTLRKAQRACRSSGGVCEADSTSKARRATAQKLRKYDARCCIIFTERYRSGHNEAVLKTVWAQAHKGSNPFLSANRNLIQTLVLG